MIWVIRSRNGLYWLGGTFPPWTINPALATRFGDKLEAAGVVKYIHGCQVITLEDAELLVIVEAL